MIVTKQCRMCGCRKPLALFQKDARKSLGVSGRCKECANNYNKERYTTNKAFASQLKYKYNLTVEEYHTLLANQGGGCAICGTTGKFHVDHDHATGVVRGILCHRCNIALGFFEKTPDLMRLFIQYLGKENF